MEAEIAAATASVSLQCVLISASTGSRISHGAAVSSVSATGRFNAMRIRSHSLSFCGGIRFAQSW